MGETMGPCRSEVNRYGPRVREMSWVVTVPSMP